MKKKVKNNFIILTLFIGVLLIWMFLFGVKQEFINVSSIDYSKTDLIKNEQVYIELSHNGIRNKPQTISLNENDCKDGKTYISLSLPFNPQCQWCGYPIMATEEVYWDGTDFKSKGGYEYLKTIGGKSFNVQNAYVNGLEVHDLEGSCTINYQRKPSDSTVQAGSNWRNDRTQYWYYYVTLSCNAQGWITCDYESRTPNFNANNKYTINSKSITVKIPKDGKTECYDDSWCESNQGCLFNKCVDIVVETEEIPESNDIQIDVESEKNKQEIVQQYIDDKMLGEISLLACVVIFLILVLIIYIAYNLIKR